MRRQKVDKKNRTELLDTKNIILGIENMLAGMNKRYVFQKRKTSKLEDTAIENNQNKE